MQQKFVSLSALAMVLAGLAAGVGTAQESAAVSRLQQEVAQLRFQLDIESGQLEREVEQLRARLDRLQYAPKPLSTEEIAPLPPLPASPGVADEIELRRLVISDNQSRPRLVFTVGEQFGPMIALINAAGDVEAMLSAPADGSRLELFEADGRPRARLPEPPG